MSALSLYMKISRKVGLVLLVLISVSSLVSLGYSFNYAENEIEVSKEDVSVAPDYYIKHVLVNAERNAPMNVYATNPSRDTLSVDFKGSTDMLVNGSSPRYLDDIVNFNNAPIQDFWDTGSWMEIKNTSSISTDVNMSISLNIIQLGSLEIDKQTIFDVYGGSTDKWLAVTMDLTPGVYILYSAHAITPRIVSPMNLTISYKGIQFGGNSGIMGYLFATQLEGIHTLYFKNPGAGYWHLIFNLKSYKGGVVEPNIYTEQKESNVAVEQTTEAIDLTDGPIYVYEMAVHEGTSLVIDFIDFYDSSIAYYVYPNGGYMEIYTLENTTNSKEYLLPTVVNGTGYFVVVNPDFWIFDTAGGLSYRTYQWYGFRYYEVANPEIDIGGNSVYTLGPLEEKYVKLSVSATTGLMLNYSISSSILLDANLFVYDSDAYTWRLWTSYMNCPPSEPYYAYILSAGEYYIHLISTDSCNSQYIEISLTELSILNDSVNHIEMETYSQEIFPANKSAVTFMPLWSSGGGQYLPVIIPISVNLVNATWGINISMYREDNRAIIDNNSVFIGVNQKMIVKSHYGDSFFIPWTDYDNGGNLLMNFESIDNESSSLTTTDTIQGTLTGWLIVQPYSNLLFNGSSTYYINDSIKLRIGTFDVSVRNYYDDYGDIDGHFIDLAAVDFAESPYNTTSFYDYSASINGSLYHSLVLKINSTRIIDWYKFIIRSHNTDGIRVHLLCPSNVWTSPDEPNTPYLVYSGPNYNQNNRNVTFEMGIASQIFYLIIDIHPLNVSESVNYWIEIRSENAPSFGAFTNLGYMAPQTEVNSLALGLGLGIGGAVVVVGLFVFWRKKKR